MQSLQIHDLFELLGPNSKPLIDQINELKRLRSEYEQTVQEARVKENNIAELYRVNASNLEQIQYENNQRQEELMRAADHLRDRVATTEQRELQLQERMQNVELREAQLKQLDVSITQRYNVVAQKESDLHLRDQNLAQKEAKTQKLIEDLKGYLCQLT